MATKMKAKVISHAGIYIDLAKVKCFKLAGFNGMGKKNALTVEFISRLEYIWNPALKEWHKEVFNDATEIEFPDYETAKAYAKEWAEIWQDYLDEN